MGSPNPPQKHGAAGYLGAWLDILGTPPERGDGRQQEEILGSGHEKVGAHLVRQLSRATRPVPLVLHGGSRPFTEGGSPRSVGIGGTAGRNLVKSGLVRGMAATVQTRVADDMVARLGGQRVHPVLGTAQLIEWMEWAGRKLILPYLEADEDAIGYRIEVVHLKPCRVGDSFTATAEFRAVEGNRVIAEVYADGPRGRLGQGQFVQVVLPRSTLEAQWNPS